jgi:hypothetical protein
MISLCKCNFRGTEGAEAEYRELGEWEIKARVFASKFLKFSTTIQFETLCIHLPRSKNVLSRWNTLIYYFQMWVAFIKYTVCVRHCS